MAEKKKNIFAGIGAKIKGITSELKKVVWPTKEKLKSITAVVFVVIVFFAIFLTAISEGGHILLEKVGFYKQVEATETTVAETEAAPAETEAAAETDAAEIQSISNEAEDAGETTAETSADAE